MATGLRDLGTSTPLVTDPADLSASDRFVVVDDDAVAFNVANPLAPQLPELRQVRAPTGLEAMALAADSATKARILAALSAAAGAQQVLPSSGLAGGGRLDKVGPVVLGLADSGVTADEVNGIDVDRYGRVVGVRRDVVNVRDRRYGAKGTGLVDDTAALNAAVAALPATGGTLVIPPGIYPTTTGLLFNARHNVTIRGTWGGNNPPGTGGVNGSVIYWTGGNGTAVGGYAGMKTVLKFFDCEFFSVSGLAVNLGNATYCEGIRIDSNNVPANTHSWELHNVYIVGGGASDYRTAHTVGVQIGTSGLTGYQSDTGNLKNVTTEQVSDGFCIDSANAQQSGIFEICRWVDVNVGCRLKIHSYHKFQSCTAGFNTAIGVVGEMFRMEGVGNQVTIEQCQCEGGAPGTMLLHVTGTATPDNAHPITLISNGIDKDVVLDAFRNLVCVGNTWSFGLCYLNADGSNAVSVNETPAADPFVLVGQTTRVTYIDANGVRVRGQSNAGGPGTANYQLGPTNPVGVYGGFMLRDGATGRVLWTADEGAAANGLRFTPLGPDCPTGLRFGTALGTLTPVGTALYTHSPGEGTVHGFSAGTPGQPCANPSVQFLNQGDGGGNFAYLFCGNGGLVPGGVGLFDYTTGRFPWLIARNALDGAFQINSGGGQLTGAWFVGGSGTVWFDEFSSGLLRLHGNVYVTGDLTCDGAVVTSLHAPPADVALDPGDMAVWFDQTNGAAKLMVKAKQADGTVRTGSLALA